MILRTVASNSPRRRNNSPIEQLNLQFTAPIDPDADPVEQAQLRGEQSAEFLQAVTAARQQGVVNLLRVPGEQQVMLRVTVAEVNRSAARNIGLNFQVVNDSGVPVFSQLTGGLISSAASGGTSGVTTLAGNLPTILDNGQIPIAINALRTLGLARSLAEPNLVTTNGQMARFHAGGSFPVPVVTGATSVGLQGVAYVPFGVQLTFTPTITDRDRVRLLVAATVSTRDESIGTNIGSSGGSGGSSSGGSNVPGLQSRNFMTTVELREGQTLAVAGLIQNNYGANSSRVPFAGDLPFLGRLFSNSGASSQEQELVVLITPELVHPLPSGEQPALPGSDIFEPDDCEFYLLGRMESRRSEDFRSAVRTDYQRLKADRR
jgi:pilus assembly protein CpaC